MMIREKKKKEDEDDNEDDNSSISLRLLPLSMPQYYFMELLFLCPLFLLSFLSYISLVSFHLFSIFLLYPWCFFVSPFSISFSLSIFFPYYMPNVPQCFVRFKNPLPRIMGSCKRLKIVIIRKNFASKEIC